MTRHFSKILSHYQSFWYIYTPLIVTLLIGFVFLWIFRNQINPDGVSYFQVANSYASFNIKEAINGYWSPLLSWLLIPFIWLHIEPLYAYRAVSLLLSLLLIGFIGFIVTHKYPHSTRLQKTGTALLLSVLGITVIQWSSSIITPDALTGIILVLCMYFFYMYLSEPNDQRYPLLLGLSLSGLYFSKSIGFYIALAILAVLFAYVVKRKLSYQMYAIAAGTFAVLTAIWIGLLFLKYETFTISTSSSYNIALYGPSKPDHPQTVEGYLPTPYPTSVWAWDDPSNFALPAWDKLEHFWFFKFHFIETFSHSIFLLVTATPLVIVGLYTVFYRKKDTFASHIGYILLGCSLLLLVAYSFILYIEERYVWFVAIPIATYAILLVYSTKQTKALTLLFGLFLCHSLLLSASFYQKSDNIMHEEAAIKNLSRDAGQRTTDHSKTAGFYPYNYKFCYFAKLQCVGNYKLTGNINHDTPIIDVMRSKGIVYYADFSDANISYLPTVFHKRSAEEICFDDKTGKNRPCDSLVLRVYKLQ